MQTSRLQKPKDLVPEHSFSPAHTHLNSLEKYRRKAGHYDSTTHRTDAIREETIAQLQLQSGDLVLDVGSGTGKSISLLRQAIGDAGHVFGIEQSPEMHRLALEKQAREGWENVSLICDFCECVVLPEKFDSLLFHYTHDILQSAAAVENLLAHAKPGARVAIAGMKCFPWWTGPLNLIAFAKNYAWNGNKRGLFTPWAHLAPRLTDWQWRSTQLGMGYIASGRVRGR
jgi:arsenite methyltransferase